MQKKRQIELLKKLTKKHLGENFDLQQIDFEALIDGSLSYEENKNKLMIDIQQYALNPIKIDTEELNRIDKIQVQQQKFQLELEAQELFDKSVEEIKSSPPALDKYYQPQYQILNALITSKKIHAMIICGEAGLGKSWNTKKALAVANQKFTLINTYATPLELYQLLYEHKDNEIIILDDIFKIFEDDVSLGILLSAMWEPRIVSYFSSSSKLKIPNSFDFNSKIVILCNDIPSKLRSVLSRCFIFRQKFSYQTKVKMIYELCKQEKIEVEVADFIKEHTNQAFNIDLRLPFKISDIKNNNEEWTEIALSQVEADERKCFIIDLNSNGKTVKEQIKEFTERFGQSRATFFNLKRELNI